MKYVNGASVITGLVRTSTPGRRMYYRYTEIPRVLNGLGISILSTSKGLAGRTPTAAGRRPAARRSATFGKDPSLP